MDSGKSRRRVMTQLLFITTFIAFLILLHIHSDYGKSLSMLSDFSSVKSVKTCCGYCIYGIAVGI